MGPICIGYTEKEASDDRGYGKSSSSSSSQVFLKWPKQQTPPQGPLQSQSSKHAGSDSVVAATKQISL